MRSRLNPVRSSLFALLFAATSGCFAEVDDPPAGTGPSCDPGTLGCECANGLCEMNYECAPANICTPIDCQPGTAICECDTGEQCDGDLVCTSGVCLPMNPGTTTDEPTTSAVTSSSATMTATITTTGDPTMSTTNTMTDTTTSTTTNVDSSSTTSSEDDTSSTTEGLVDCAQVGIDTGSCSMCFTCTEDPGQSCATLHTMCSSTPGCQQLNGCLVNCETEGICPPMSETCCTVQNNPPPSDEAIMIATQLSQCHRDECISPVCAEYIEDGACESPP